MTKVEGTPSTTQPEKEITVFCHTCLKKKKREGAKKHRMRFSEAAAELMNVRWYVGAKPGSELQRCPPASGCAGAALPARPVPLCCSWTWTAAELLVSIHRSGTALHLEEGKAVCNCSCLRAGQPLGKEQICKEQRGSSHCF